MAGKCFPLVGGRVMRATRLDGCGRPVFGDCGQVVSDGFVSINVTANVDEGDEISVANANGKTCVRQTPCPQLTGYSLEIAFCQVDPDLFSLITGQSQVLDPSTEDAIGFRVNVDLSSCDSGFALEVWSNVPGIACSDDAASEGTFGYILFPFLQGGVIGDFTIENDAVSFTITGASTKSGGAWGVGPYNVTLTGASIAGPLTDPILAGDHLHVQLTEVAPPEPVCGCQPLYDGDATSAEAGTPGTWLPENGAPPLDFADLTSAAPPIVASPTTAWTSGRNVVLQDGTLAHWDGTAWVVGAAV